MAYSAKEILSQPLASFLLDDPARSLDVPPVRTGTTSTWAQEFLRTISLSPLQWDWESEPEFRDFWKQVGNVPGKFDAAPGHPYMYPRNEADTVDAMSRQLVYPVYDVVEKGIIAKSVPWLDKLRGVFQETALAPNIEALSECTLKRSTDTKYTSDGVDVHNVRVDVLFVTSLQPLRKGQPLPDGFQHPYTRTRQRGIILKRLGSIHSHYQTTDERFMQEGEFWKTPPTKSGSNTTVPQVDGADKARLKSLIVLEIKDYYSLDEAMLKLIAEYRISLDGGAISAPLKPQAAAIQGTISILQQILRYDVTYATHVISVGDYRKLLIFDPKSVRQAMENVSKLNKDLASGKEKDVSGAGGVEARGKEDGSGNLSERLNQLSWALVDKKDARRALAYMLYRGMHEVEDELQAAGLTKLKSSGTKK